MGANCSEVNHCHGFLCENGGTCVNTNETAICECTFGFRDIHCENVDHCPKDKCQGHGTCDTVNGDCTCDSGYTGAYCELQVIVEIKPPKKVVKVPKKEEIIGKLLEKYVMPAEFLNKTIVLQRVVFTEISVLKLFGSECWTGRINSNQNSLSRLNDR